MNSSEIARIKELMTISVKYAREVKDDAEALSLSFLYKQWSKQIGKELVAGEYIQHEEVLYKVLQAHTVVENWKPGDAPSIFAKVLVDPNGEVLDWVQPDSTNAYMIGDKVKFEGKVYISLIDNNIWSPSALPSGWEEE